MHCSFEIVMEHIYIVLYLLFQIIDYAIAKVAGSNSHTYCYKCDPHFQECHSLIVVIVVQVFYWLCSNSIQFVGLVQWSLQILRPSGLH